MHATVEHLRALVERYATVPPEQWGRFATRLRQRALPKHRHLLRIGQVSGELAFVTQGLVRRYALSSGREVNLAFLCEGSFATAFTSFVEQRPSELAVQAMEGTHLLTLSHASMVELSGGHPCWQRFALGAAAAKLRWESERERALLGLSAEERYEGLLRSWPGVELRVPQRHIIRRTAGRTLRGRIRARSDTLVVDRPGVPLAVVTGANVHDSEVLDGASDAVAPLRDGRAGRPRRRVDEPGVDRLRVHRTDSWRGRGTGPCPAAAGGWS